MWDFGGQSVYYVTHPIFLTTKAIYLLAYDLRKDPTEIATPLLKEGVFDRKEDLYCTKTNEDYLRVWLSSVASLGMIDLGSKGSEKLPKKVTSSYFSVHTRRSMWKGRERSSAQNIWHSSF